MGPALVDVGSPFGEGTAVISCTAVPDPREPVQLYSIVEAADLAEATLPADGHPFLSEGLGSYAIDLFELMPVPFEAEASLRRPSSSSGIRRFEDRSYSGEVLPVGATHGPGHHRRGDVRESGRRPPVAEGHGRAT